MARQRARKQESGTGSLREYRRKRDFSRTQEPAGDVRNALRDTLEFVIQKHAASHLHYDLRLEAGGVMRSWAVPKGPSLDPAVKRLAMQVEDHPVEYNTFEGTIPQGEYGGGTVMLWDRGRYEPDDRRPGESVDAAVQRGLKRGRLAFTMHGERLQGGFNLVRTDGGAKPKWLFFKQRDGTEAPERDITAEVVTSVESGRTMEEIAGEADRVWHSNRGEKKRARSRAAAGQDALPPELRPQRPRPARSLPDGDWLLMPWFGGEPVLAFCTPEGTVMLGERGDMMDGAGDSAASLQSLAQRVGEPFIVTGELDDDGTLHLEELLMRGDVLYVEETAKVRRKSLEALLSRRRVKGVVLKPVTTSEATMSRRAAQTGAAGVLARRADSPYRPGRRNDDLLRISAV